jgi:hypothetical protein
LALVRPQINAIVTIIGMPIKAKAAIPIKRLLNILITFKVSVEFVN